MPAQDTTHGDFQQPQHSAHGFFTAHPASVDETYFQHMCFALKFSATMFYAAFAALVHAFLPAFFEKTASKIVIRLHHRVTHRTD